MKKEKNKTIEALQINKKDVGSSEVQIGLLSDKINSLCANFKKNKNDQHSTIGQLTESEISHLKANNLIS